MKFEVERQAGSPSLCASVRVVPWADEAEQQLSRLAPSGCELCADVRIFGAGLPKGAWQGPPSPTLCFKFPAPQYCPALCPISHSVILSCCLCLFVYSSLSVPQPSAFFSLLLPCCPTEAFPPSSLSCSPVSYFGLSFTLSYLPVPFFSLIITLSRSLSLSFSDNLSCSLSFSPFAIISRSSSELSFLLFLSYCPSASFATAVLLPGPCFLSPSLCPASCPQFFCLSFSILLPVRSFLAVPACAAGSPFLPFSPSLPASRPVLVFLSVCPLSPCWFVLGFQP